MTLPSIHQYLPEMADSLLKLAEGEEKPLPERPLLHAAKAVGSGLVGLGGGIAAGAGLGYGAKKLYEHTTGHPISSPHLKYLLAAAPLIAGAGGLAHNLYTSHEQEELRRALESYRNQSGRRSSDQ